MNEVQLSVHFSNLQMADLFANVNTELASTLAELKPMVTDIQTRTREIRSAQFMISRKFHSLAPYLRVNVLLVKAIRDLYTEITRNDWDHYYRPMVIQLIDFSLFNLFIMYLPTFTDSYVVLFSTQ